jgi:hypothetical protein
MVREVPRPGDTLLDEIESLNRDGFADVVGVAASSFARGSPTART